uniref:Uncharacterized protein n=1 Tax=Rhizophagus irregularis (strain DAOM 181602 / DAOM 197198 / MUCL 43194) TaxID=747089 RepID=U9TZY0_RHIID
MIKKILQYFFSGALSLIKDKLYLELQNFSFIHINTSSEKQMPWLILGTSIFYMSPTRFQYFNKIVALTTDNESAAMMELNYSTLKVATDAFIQELQELSSTGMIGSSLLSA